MVAHLLAGASFGELALMQVAVASCTSWRQNTSLLRVAAQQSKQPVALLRGRSVSHTAWALACAALNRNTA